MTTSQLALLAPAAGIVSGIAIELIKQKFERYKKKQDAIAEKDKFISQFSLEEKKLQQVDTSFLMEALRKEYEMVVSDRNYERELRNNLETQLRMVNQVVDQLETERDNALLELHKEKALSCIKDLKLKELGYIPT